ncbi:MAG: hypothetical protein H7329_16225 [Opitutaceae bacterium]|nr:hypothetical protein [Cytophagales bacterium]
MNRIFLTLLIVSLFFSCRKKKCDQDPLPNLETIENNKGKWVDISPKNAGRHMPTEASFLNENEGYVLSQYHDSLDNIYDVVIRTLNGGMTWTEHRLPPNPGSFKHIFAVNDSVLFAGSDRGQYKSNDKGVSWTFIAPYDAGGYAYGIYFINQNLGFAVRGEVKKTDAGGYTWQESSYLPSTSEVDNGNWCWELRFVTNNVGFAFGGNYLFHPPTEPGGSVNFGSLIKTNDQGKSWTKISGKNMFGYIYDLSMVNERLGYMLAFPYAPPSDNLSVQLLRTVDGGFTWELVRDNSQFSNIYFWNQNEGISLGISIDNSIYYTSNGGKTWVKEYEGQKFNDPGVSISWNLTAKGRAVFALSSYGSSEEPHTTKILKRTF